MAKTFYKSFSNYILKSNPIPTDNGTILENDLLSYGYPYSYVNGNLTIRTNGGFTFITNTTPTDNKIYSNGDFNNTYTLNDLLTASTTGSTSIDVASLNIQLVPTPTYITFNKTYFDLAKFCYFGSTNAFIQSSIEDIINRFPAGLYVSNSSVITGNTTNTITIPMSGISNPYNLNLLDYMYDRNLMSYDLKTLATSFSDYVVVTTGDTQIAAVTGFTGNPTSIIINLDSSVNINTSFFVRPSLKKQNDFFNSLDDFQSTLLNRHSSPKYKSVFKIPEENEIGISNVYRNFVWQTYDGYNLDITSTDYTLFIQELIDGSNFVDEMYSDNIYRIMTHDTIKNMDTTYQRVVDPDLLDEYIAGGTKIQSLLRLYGRFYDEIKKYADGIAFTNNISYDKVDNLPDIYLQGKLSSLGWETETLSNIFPVSGITSTNLFPGFTGGFNRDEVINEINRRMILSSKSITKSKGTKKSIRKIFGLLGIDESIYEIREYVQKVDGYITGSTLQNIIGLNQDLRAIQIENLYGSSNILSDDILLTGINIGTFVMSPSGSTNYTSTGDTATDLDFGELFSISGHTYGYPLPRPNANDYYFQQMGGWYRETGGVHTDLTGGTYVTNITTGNNPHSGNGNYDYGFDYIDQFKNLFKTDINLQGNSPTINLTGFTNQGFSISDNIIIDNKKIKWVGNQNYFCGNNVLVDDTGVPILTDGGDYIYISDNNKSDSNLTINLKNFVIGIDGQQALNLFYSGNTIGVTGLTQDDVFNYIKILVLPYLEQVIPSSTIFDFVLIDKNTPKWILVDKYCDRFNDVNQNYNGQTILRYKNMNYFDETSTGFTDDLTNQVENDFGNMFTNIPTAKDSIVGFGREILFTGDNGDCDVDTSGKWVVYENLFNYLND